MKSTQTKIKDYFFTDDDDFIKKEKLNKMIDSDYEDESDEEILDMRKHKLLKIESDLDVPIPKPSAKWLEEFGDKQPLRSDGLLTPYNYKEEAWNPGWDSEFKRRYELSTQNRYYNFNTLLEAKLGPDNVKGLSRALFDTTSRENKFLRSLQERKDLESLKPLAIQGDIKKLEEIKIEVVKDLETLKKNKVNVSLAIEKFNEKISKKNYLDINLKNFFVKLSNGITQYKTLKKKYIERDYDKIFETAEQSTILPYYEQLLEMTSIQKTFFYEKLLFPKNVVKISDLPNLKSKLDHFEKVFTENESYKSDLVTFKKDQYLNLYREISSFIQILKAGGVVLETILINELAEDKSSELRGDSYISMGTESQEIVNEKIERFRNLWNNKDDDFVNTLTTSIANVAENIFTPKNPSQLISKKYISLRYLEVIYLAYTSKQINLLNSSITSLNAALLMRTSRLEEISSGKYTTRPIDLSYQTTYENTNNSLNTGTFDLTPFAGQIKSVYLQMKSKPLMQKYMRNKDVDFFLTDERVINQFADLVASEFRKADISHSKSTYFRKDANGLTNMTISPAWQFFYQEAQTANKVNI